MKTLEELYLEIKDLNNEEKERILEEKANALIPILDEIADRNFNGYSLLYSIILAATSVDGAVSFEEATMLLPFFKNFFHEKVDLNEIKDALLVNGNAKDSIAYTKSMLSIVESVDYVAKEDILSICLIALSSDGLTDNEKDWLRQIY